jgi:hypothetical protein
MALKQSDLRPRKRASKAKPAAPAPEEILQESNEELVKVSDILAPEDPAIITVHLDSGETRDVQIRKCKARQIGYVMRFLANAFKITGITDFKQAAQAAEALQDPNVLLNVLSDIMEDAIATAAQLTDLTVDEFHELDLDDAVAVMLAVWTVNQSFFSARVLPMIQNIMARGGLDQWTSPAKTPSDTESDISTASSG